MLNLNDIVQLILLCALIFIPLGYAFHRRFPHFASILAKPVVIAALFEIRRFVGAHRLLISD